jgi:hypothetical protein
VPPGGAHASAPEAGESYSASDTWPTTS